jgi:hypothetical protein
MWTVHRNEKKKVKKEKISKQMKWIINKW